MLKPFKNSDLNPIVEAYLNISEARYREGFGADGFNEEGFDALGYDREGYDRTGHDVFGCDRSGYDAEGYDRLGFNREGWSKEGWPSPRLNPDAYGIMPEQVDEFIKNAEKEREWRIRRSLNVQVSTGKDVSGKYSKGRVYRKHSDVPKSWDEWRFQQNLKKFNKQLKDERKAERDAIRTAAKEEKMATPEWQAKQKAHKEAAYKKQLEYIKTPEYKAKQKAYMADYLRAKKLLSGNVKWTIDDILWAKTNETFRKMKKRYDDAALKKQKESGGFYPA